MGLGLCGAATSGVPSHMWPVSPTLAGTDTGCPQHRMPWASAWDSLFSPSRRCVTPGSREARPGWPRVLLHGAWLLVDGSASGWHTEVLGS